MFKKIIAPVIAALALAATPALADVAVVYFSQTNNTKTVAEVIAAELGVEAQAITPAVAYAPEDLNKEGGRARDEHNDAASRPELATSPDVSAADTVFVGWPVWWGNAPKVVYSWIDAANLQGKKIIPFCTSGSQPIDGSLDMLKAAYPDLTFEAGARFTGKGDDAEVKTWVDSLGLK